MYGLAVIEVISLSGNLSNIDEITSTMHYISHQGLLTRQESRAAGPYGDLTTSQII